LEDRTVPSVFTVTTTADSGTGSLRAAITAANTNPGTDTIKFAIPGTGVKTIALSSALPAITDPVIINGKTQPNFPMIVLNGTGAGASVNGLTLGTGSAGSTLEGLVIEDFTVNGIVIESNGNLITGNRIGTDPTGTQARPNGFHGVEVDFSANNLILGNVISGNGGAGISMSGSTTAGNFVTGNRIGTNAAGTAALPNAGNGVEMIASAGAGTVESNLISGNKVDGVFLGSNSPLSTVAHNLIGVSAVLGKLGNGKDGLEIDSNQNLIAGNRIWFNAIGIVLSVGQHNQIQGNNIAFSGGNGVFVVSGAAFNSIGGTAAGQGNIISQNHGAGVILENGSANDAILGNAIFANTGGGIVLLSGNNQQASPTLVFAAFNGIDNTTVVGTLQAAANTNYRIEFFNNPSGGDQGQKFVGFVHVATDANGTATFVEDFAGAGASITATATDQNGNTSAFSQPVAVALL
jgi:parallel beta-helix repeat protein